MNKLQTLLARIFSRDPGGREGEWVMTKRNRQYYKPGQSKLIAELEWFRSSDGALKWFPDSFNPNTGQHVQIMLDLDLEASLRQRGRRDV